MSALSHGFTSLAGTCCELPLAAACWWKLSKITEAATVVVRSFSMLKSHCSRRYRTLAHNLCEELAQPDSQTVFLPAKWHRCTPDSNQRSWSGCRLWRRGTKWWEGVKHAEKCPVKHDVRWDESCVRKRGRRTSCEHLQPWATRMCVCKSNVLRTCATRQDWEKCACDEVFCPEFSTVMFR